MNVVREDCILVEGTRYTQVRHPRSCWRPVGGSRNGDSATQRPLYGRQQIQLTRAQDDGVSRTVKRRRQRQRRLRQLHWGATLLRMVREFAEREAQAPMCATLNNVLQQCGVKMSTACEKAAQTEVALLASLEEDASEFSSGDTEGRAPLARGTTGTV